MPSPPHNHWVPELWLNGEYVCVRYVYGRDQVSRHVYSWHTDAAFFASETEAQAQCDALNLKVERWCHSCRRTHAPHHA